MSIKVRPISYAIGAEITGVDLAKPLDDAQWAEIYAAWLKHILLVFPGQKLTPEQQIAFGRRFGPLDDHWEDPTYRLPGFPEIYQIGNFMLDGKMSKTKDTGRKWHSDHSYTTRPTLISMLYCRKIPPVGGTTAFANMYMAYDTLTDTMKGMLENLEAVHDMLNYLTPTLLWKPTVKDPSAMAKKFPAVVHPVVRTHPETGRKALYVSEGQTTRILGLSEEEGRGLLQFLFKHATQLEFTYRHAYKVDDLVFWDNRCAQHIALADYVHNSDNLRHMYRVTVLGKKSGRLYEPLADTQPEKQPEKQAA